MKKTRTIKIQVATREILLARAGETNAAAEQINLTICPLCHSHLTETLPVSASAITVAELTDERTKTEID